VNGATDALSIGPSAGYNLFFVFVHILLLFIAYVSSDTHMHIHVVTYITVILWIKLKLKMSISPTIKLYLRLSDYFFMKNHKHEPLVSMKTYVHGNFLPQSARHMSIDLQQEDHIPYPTHVSLPYIIFLYFLW
jgi:hypothetical protein